MGQINTETSTYTSNRGLAIKIIPISAMAVGALRSDQTGKPIPPFVEVNIAGNKRMMENTDDPAYKERMKDWENDRNMQMMRYVIAAGTNIPAPADWIETMGNFFPNPTPTNLRVYWLFEQLESDEVPELMDHIMGLSMPTESGLKLARDRFPSDDQRQ